jgi:hypothetical protein
MAPTGALGRRGNTDPETTIGTWGGVGSSVAKAGNGASTAAKGLGSAGGRAARGATGTADPAKPINAGDDTACALAGVVRGAKGDTTAGADGGTGGTAGETATPKGVDFDSAKGAVAGI